MLVPEDEPTERLRHLLQVTRTRQADIAKELGITGGRFSQLLKSGDFKVHQLRTMREHVPSFTAEYFLEGYHPVDQLRLTPWAKLAPAFPLAPLLYHQLRCSVSKGGARGTVIRMHAQIVRVQWEDAADFLRADPWE